MREEDKPFKERSWFYRNKVELKLKIDRFNRKTHGLGLLLIIAMIAFAVIQFLPILIQSINQKQVSSNVYTDVRGNRVILCPDSCIWRAYF